MSKALCSRQKYDANHSCMPSPLAPDQSGFIHVFVVYSEPIEILLGIFLSLIGAISKWKYLLPLKLELREKNYK